MHSKASGAEWALPRLPADLRSRVERTLASYRGAGEAIDVDDDERLRLQAYAEQRVFAIAVS